MVSQRGFTLIEVLIAMFIAAGAMMALGLYGLKTMQYSQLAFQRTIATIQVNDLIDRMWAEPCEPIYLDQVKQQWDQHWSNINTNHLNLTEGQIAIQQLLFERRSEMQYPSDGSNVYEIDLQWKNTKINAIHKQDHVTQVFKFQFELPTCNTSV